MNFKQVLGLLLSILGVVCLFVAHSIDVRLDEGREQISDAESQVGRGRRLFSGSPVTRETGNTLLFNPADKKINAAKGDIDHYALLAEEDGDLEFAPFLALVMEQHLLATQLRVGGIVLIISGIGVIYFFRNK